MSELRCRQNTVNDDRCEQLTDDHKGEKVSVQKVPQHRLVPRFHANYSGDQVNQGDGLRADQTHNLSANLLQIYLYPSKIFWNLSKADINGATNGWN